MAEVRFAPTGPPVLPPVGADWGDIFARPSPDARLPGPTIPPVPPVEPPRFPPRASWCLGAEREACQGVTLFGIDASRACEAASNLACLAAGLAVLMAVLGLSINALLRGD